MNYTCLCSNTITPPSHYYPKIIPCPGCFRVYLARTWSPNPKINEEAEAINADIKAILGDNGDDEVKLLLLRETYDKGILRQLYAVKRAYDKEVKIVGNTAGVYVPRNWLEEGHTVTVMVK